MAAITARTVIMYLSLILTMRLLGKRQLGEMELSEFVLAALAADIASNPLQDLNIPLMYAIIPIVTLFCMELLIAGAAMKNIRFRSFIYGKPSILIKKGRLCQDELRKNRLTLDELTAELRSGGCVDISSVEYAVLETDGGLSIISYPDSRPLTPGDIAIKADTGGYPRAIISDGRIIDKNLEGLGLNRDWLNKKLKELGCKEPKEVFYMSVDEYQKVYMAAMEGKK